jgi:hypothetical protein
MPSPITAVDGNIPPPSILSYAFSDLPAENHCFGLLASIYTPHVIQFRSIPLNNRRGPHEIRQDHLLDRRLGNSRNHAFPLPHDRPPRPAAITHPGFYYGFAGCALAWQLALIVIATDPIRFHTMMLPSVFEKFSVGAATTVLYLQHRLPTSDLALVGIDTLLGVLFLLALFELRQSQHRSLEMVQELS